MHFLTSVRVISVKRKSFSMSAASLFTPNMLNIYSSNAWDGDFYSLLKHSRLIEEIWNKIGEK